MTEHNEQPEGDWTESRILEQARELERVWGPAKAVQNVRQAFYHNEAPVEVKGGPELLIKPLPVRLGVYPFLIRRIASTLTTKATYNIDAYGVGQGPERAAEKAERYLNTAPIIQERQQKEQINRSVTRQAILHGLAGVKTLPHPSLWKDWPKQGKHQSAKEYNAQVEDWQRHDAPFPAVSWPIAALDWYPLIAGRQVIISMEKKKVPVAWVRKRYPDATEGWTAKNTDDVTLYEFIDNERCGYYIEHAESNGKVQALRTWEHHMGGEDAPVALYEGISTEDSDPLRAYQGCLDDLEDAIAAKDFLATRAKHVVRIFWQPTMKLRLMQAFTPEALAAATREREWIWGGTNHEFAGPDGVTGEEYSLAENPSALPDAQVLREIIDDRINQEFPPAMLGSSPAGDAGYKTNRDIQQAEKLLSVIADSLAYGDVDRGVHLLQVPRAISLITGKDDVPVYVRERTEKGSEPISAKWSNVKTYIPLLAVDRKVVLDIDRQYQADAMGKWLSPPIGMNRKWVFTNIGNIENPVEQDDQKWQEDMERSDAIRKRDEELFMRKVTDERDAKEGITVQELMDMQARGEPVPPELLAAFGVNGETPQGVPGAPTVPGAGMMPGEGETLTPPAPQGIAGPAMGPRAGQSRQQPRRLPPASPEGQG